jgi:integrase
MPRLVHKPPAYSLHKPSGQAKIKDQGRTIYLGKYGSPESWEKYHRLLAERYGRTDAIGQQRIQPEATPLTVNEVAVAYFRHCEQYYVKNGEQTNQVLMIRLALQVLHQLYGSILIREFGPINLKACRAEFIRQGLSRGECNRRTNLIKQCFRWAAENEMVPRGLYHDLQAVVGLRKGRCEARDPAPVGPVPEAIVERTIEHLCPTVEGMVRLQLATAMRPGELVTMRACDLNMAGPIWEYRPPSHKTDHHEGILPRIIMLGPRAIEILRPFLCLDISGYLFSPKRATVEQAAGRRLERKTKLWPSHVDYQVKKRERRGRKPLHDHYNVNAYRRAIARACDRAFPHPDLSGVPCKKITADQKTELEAWRKSHRWHPNQLRHSAATLIRRKYGIEAAQAVLGHSQIDTSELYAEKSLEAARQIMKEIG